MSSTAQTPRRSPSAQRRRQRRPLVGIIMGSQSDWPTMQFAANVLDTLDVPYEKRVVSAHRTPELMATYAKEARKRGLRAIIAGAGGAAHLPGMVAAQTILPVLGVPVRSRSLDGLDSLLSIAQMPAGIPVATFSIGPNGAANAAIFAAQIIARSDSTVADKLEHLAHSLESTWDGLSKE